MIVDSETIVFLVVVIIVIGLSLNHMNQPVVRLRGILHVQVLSRELFLLQARLNHIFEHGPAVLNIEIDLISETIWIDVDKSDYLVSL